MTERAVVSLSRPRRSVALDGEVWGEDWLPHILCPILVLPSVSAPHFQLLCEMRQACEYKRSPQWEVFNRIQIRGLVWRP